MEEMTYTVMLITIAMHSSCSARLAVRQVQTTFPKPQTAASKQASPKTAPAVPNAAP